MANPREVLSEIDRLTVWDQADSDRLFPKTNSPSRTTGLALLVGTGAAAAWWLSAGRTTMVLGTIAIGLPFVRLYTNMHRRMAFDEGLELGVESGVHRAIGITAAEAVRLQQVVDDPWNRLLDADDAAAVDKP